MPPLFFILILTPFVSAGKITATGGFQGVDQWFLDALQELSVDFSSLVEDAETILGYASSLLDLRNPYYGYVIYTFTKVTVTSGISKIHCGGGYVHFTPYSAFVVPEEGSCTPGCDPSQTSCQGMQQYLDYIPTFVTPDTLKAEFATSVNRFFGNPTVFYATNDYYIIFNSSRTAPTFQNMRS